MMNLTQNTKSAIILLILLFFISSLLSPGCKKKNDEPDTVQHYFRVYESKYFDNNGDILKTTYEYHNDLLVRAILYDSMGTGQWAAAMKEEVQYPDGNTVVITSYNNYPGDWKESSKLEVKLEQDRVVEISDFYKKDNDWEIHLNKTFAYTGDLLQQEIRTIWMDGDFSITEKYEFEYSEERMDKAFLYLLTKDWILYYKWEYGYMETSLGNIIISGYNSTDESWYMFYKIEFDHENGNIIKVRYYDYDDISETWISDYFQQFEYDEFNNVVARKEIDSQSGQGDRQIFYYETGTGNVKQILFYQGYDETQFWMPFPMTVRQPGKIAKAWPWDSGL